MSLTLYSGPLSLFTAKVRIALAEKQIEYERVEVPFSRADGYEPKHPEVLRLNPKAQVPVLVDADEDVVLWDSTVIVEYLDERFPFPPLLPADPAERARCRMLELHADEVFFPHVMTLIRGVFYGDAKASREDPAVLSARLAIAEHYAALDALLAEPGGGREWLGGKSMTAADVGYRLVALFASSLGAAPDSSLEALGAWIARIDAVPSVGNELREIMSYVATQQN